MADPPTASAGMPAPLARADLAFALLDPRGLLVAVNEALAELLGQRLEELAGRPLAEVLAGPDLEPARLSEALSEVMAGRARRTRLDTPHPARSDRILALTITPAGASEGQEQALLLVDDVTESRRRQSEQVDLRERLGAAASEWRATFDAIEMPIFILGPEGQVERLNYAAAELAGRDFAEILGRRLGEMGGDALWQQADALVGLVVRESTPASLEVWDPASGRSWALAVSPGRPDLSVARPIILTVRELTALVQLQESLRRSRTMAAMGSLVAGVAHEVRNPLFGISAVVDALDRRMGDRQDIAEHLGHLRREVGRLERLMADLLDFGRPVVLETRPTRLDQLVADALLACAAQLARTAVEIVREVDDRPPRVLVDRRRVGQALVNLLENALHHAPGGSRVEVRVETVDRSRRRWAQVTVRDHGPGFREDDLPRLFEPFFSRREGGTGLGLPIVSRILDGHGGEVEALNAPEGGAVVRLRFPLADGAGAAERDAT